MMLSSRRIDQSIGLREDSNRVQCDSEPLYD
jgi:hypothetical protein